MRKWMNLLNEDALTKGEVTKGTWTYWQDRDGIYVIRAGSNSCFAGFCSQEEALHFAAEQGPEWQVVRRGKFKTMTDAEAMADYDVRLDRQRHGFWVPPLAERAEPHQHQWMLDANSDATYCTYPNCHATLDTEASTPTEDEQHEREMRIMKAVKEFCIKEIGWDMEDVSYPVLFDAGENALTIRPNEGEVTLEQLNKLAVLGQVTVNGSSSAYQLSVEIRTPEGFNIS